MTRGAFLAVAALFGGAVWLYSRRADAAIEPGAQPVDSLSAVLNGWYSDVQDGPSVNADQNVGAFLAMIGRSEGADYSTLYGGGTFTPGADHPRVTITAGGYSSTAAGRYQILARTWDDFVADQGPHAFDAAGQDACAVWLIRRRGALADVRAGRTAAAIAKCSKEWASFPGSPYGQRTRSLDQELAFYQGAGGTVLA